MSLIVLKSIKPGIFFCNSMNFLFYNFYWSAYEF
jgi:hypothetical protein